MKELIEAGADVAHCDNKGVNALLAATLAISKRFMEAKSHNYQNGFRDNQKQFVKESGKKKQFELLAKNYSLIQRFPIIDKRGYIEIFKLLLEKKIPVNQQEKVTK